VGWGHKTVHNKQTHPHPQKHVMSKREERERERMGGTPKRCAFAVMLPIPVAHPQCAAMTVGSRSFRDERAVKLKQLVVGPCPPRAASPSELRGDGVGMLPRCLEACRHAPRPPDSAWRETRPTWGGAR
jgi:hypothetical protein